jgi:hypothetical protein
MLHVLPFSPFVNHGFFNYNPILFRDLALANEYTFKAYIANRDGKKTKLEYRHLFKEKKPITLRETVKQMVEEHRRDVLIVASFRKTHDRPFRFPVQGKYAQSIAENLISTYSFLQPDNAAAE